MVYLVNRMSFVVRMGNVYLCQDAVIIATIVQMALMSTTVKVNWESNCINCTKLFDIITELWILAEILSYYMVAHGPMYYCLLDFEPPSLSQNITIPPRRPFEFTCSAPERSRPVVIIPSMQNLNVEDDPRFQIARPLPNTIRVRAVHGLTEADNGITFM